MEKLSPKILWPCVLGLTLLAHASYLNNGFTWLDHGDIEQGRAILPLAELHQAFTQPFGETGFYRPLVTIFHSLDAAVYGDWAPGFHLTNVLLHLIAVSCATLFIMAFFSLSVKEALLAALIFGIHPLTWLPVGAISYRPELLAVSFTFLAVFFHIKARHGIASSKTPKKRLPKPPPGRGRGGSKLARFCSKGWHTRRPCPTRNDGKGFSKYPLKFLIATQFCFLLALLAKETPIFWIPALIIFWEIFRIFGQKKIPDAEKKEQKPTPKSSRFGLFLFGGEIAALSLYAVLRMNALPEVWHTTATTLAFSEVIGTRLHVLGLRLLELLSPFKPALSDATPVHSLLGFSSLATLAVLIGLAILLFRIGYVSSGHSFEEKRAITDPPPPLPGGDAGRRFLRAGFNSPFRRIFLFVAIALLPALNIVPLPRFSSPHYGYFAAIAFGVMVVELVRNSSAWPQTARKLLLGSISAWMVIAAAMAFLHGGQFKNDLTLFEPEVAQDENFLEGHFYLGDYFMQFGDLNRAASAYKAALNAKPDVLAYLDQSSAMINYAGVLLKQNKPEEAEEFLRQVSGHVSASEQQLVDYNLALIANQRQDFARVVELLEKHRTHWQRPEPLLMLANALRQLERTPEAVETLRLALPYLDAQQRAKVLALIEASK